MLLVRYKTWNGPGPRRRERLGGGTRLGWLRDRQAGRPDVEHRHVRLDDRAPLDLRHGHAENTSVELGRRGDIGDGDVGAVDAKHAVRVAAGLRRLSAPLGQRGQVLDEEHRERVSWA